LHPLARAHLHHDGGAHGAKWPLPARDEVGLCSAGQNLQCLFAVLAANDFCSETQRTPLSHTDTHTHTHPHEYTDTHTRAPTCTRTDTW